jgi:hypothetical protein
MPAFNLENILANDAQIELIRKQKDNRKFGIRSKSNGCFSVSCKIRSSYVNCKRFGIGYHCIRVITG